MRFSKRMLVVMTFVVGAIFMSSGTAFASGKTAAASATASTSGDLYRFISKGVDSHNDVHATQQVIAYAKQNPAYGQALASQTGDASFAPSAYKADGYRPNAPVGSTNSAAGMGGQVVATADHGNSASVKVVAIINVHTMQVAYVMVRCGNLRLMRVTPIPWKPIQIGVSAKINRLVTKNATITCPSGQKVSGFVSTRVKGVIYAKTHGQVKGWAKIWLRQQADIQVKTVLTLKCGPAPKPAPAPTPPTPAPTPTATFTASATATASASAVCPDGTTATSYGSGSGYATSTVSQADADKKAHDQANATAQANAQASVKCGTAQSPATCQTPGSGNIGGPLPCVCPTGMTGVPPNCQTPPPAPCVSITSTTLLNDINEGRTSGPFYYTVNSCGSGSITVDPGVGGVSDCNSSTPSPTGFTANLSAGNNTVCVIFYAPTDTSANSMTVTATATQGNAKDVKAQTVTIKHPIRT
jgi:hypothetical protein